MPLLELIWFSLPSQAAAGVKPDAIVLSVGGGGAAD
jgi:hypothetical protein